MCETAGRLRQQKEKGSWSVLTWPRLTRQQCKKTLPKTMESEKGESDTVIKSPPSGMILQHAKSFGAHWILFGIERIQSFNVYRFLFFCTHNIFSHALQSLLHSATLVLFSPLYERPLFLKTCIAGFFALLSFSQLGF